MSHGGEFLRVVEVLVVQRVFTSCDNDALFLTPREPCISSPGSPVPYNEKCFGRGVVDAAPGFTGKVPERQRCFPHFVLHPCYAGPRSKCCRVQATTDKEHTKLKIEAAPGCTRDVFLEKAGPLTWAATCSVALRMKEHRKQSCPAGFEADPGQSEAESWRRGPVNP